MKYTLIARRFTPSDVSRDCRYTLEDDEDVDLFVSTLVEDIEGLDFVRSVTRDNFILQIELEEEIGKAELRTTMESLFARGRRCKIVLVSLEASS
jgi:hypothetical protein